MTHYLYDEIANLVIETDKLKKVLNSFFADETESLDLRWTLWLSTPQSLKNHQLWVSHLGGLEIDELMEDPFYFEKFQTINVASLMGQIENFRPDILEAAKREVLSKNLGSFVLDW